MTEASKEKPRVNVNSSGSNLSMRDSNFACWARPYPQKHIQYELNDLAKLRNTLEVYFREKSGFC